MRPDSYGPSSTFGSPGRGHPIVAHQRISEDQNLTAVRGVGEGFHVAGHRLAPASRPRIRGPASRSHHRGSVWPSQCVQYPNSELSSVPFSRSSSLRLHLSRLPRCQQLSRGVANQGRRFCGCNVSWPCLPHRRWRRGAKKREFPGQGK